MDPSWTDKVDDELSEAEYWVIRLSSPECSEREHRDFEDWLAMRPQNPADFARVQQIHLSVSQLVGDDLLTAELKRARRKGESSRKPAAVLALLGGAIAAGLVLVIGIPSWRGAQDAADPVRIVSGIGEIRHLQLADGTRVRLDTSSEMLVRFDNMAREIELTRGRIQLDVGKDGRPFAVVAGTLRARDIGTIFQVSHQAGPEHTEVALFEGVVVVQGVEDAARSVVLKPGQKVVNSPTDGAMRVEGIDIDREGAWADGVAVVRDQSLDMLVTELNRYSARKIRLADPEDGKIVVSGRYPLNDQAAVLKSLEQGWGLRITEASASEITLRR